MHNFLIGQPELLWALLGDGSILSYVYVGGDEFNGSNLDYKRWRNSYPWGRNYSGTCYQEYMTDGNNFEFENGVLKLIAKEEDIYARGVPYMDDEYLLEDNMSNLRWWNYTSGMIFSKRKFKYGRYEIRCKLPEGKGLWPAFWLFGGYPDEEIDVFEYKGENLNKIHWDVHYEDDAGVGGWVTADGNFSDGFNKLDITWAPDAIFWGLNWNDYSVWFGNLNYKESIIANLGIANDSPCAFSPGPDNTTSFPASFEIDYIRVYARLYCDEYVNICSYEQTLSDPNVITGFQVNIGGSGCDGGVLEENQYLDLFATNSINLLPGFSVVNGASFTANIVDCPGPPGYGERVQNEVINDTLLKVIADGDVENLRSDFVKENIRKPILDIRVFPNPANDFVKIEFEGLIDREIKIELINSDGKIVFNSGTIKNSKLEINTSNFPRGVYFIKGTFGESVISSKLIL